MNLSSAFKVDFFPFFSYQFSPTEGAGTTCVCVLQLSSWLCRDGVGLKRGNLAITWKSWLMTQSSHFPLFHLSFPNKNQGNSGCRETTPHFTIITYHQLHVFASAVKVWHRVGFSPAEGKSGSENLLHMSVPHISNGSGALCRGNKVHCRSQVRRDWVQEANGIHRPLRLYKPVLQPSQPARCSLKNRFVFQTCYFPAWLMLTSCITKAKTNTEGNSGTFCAAHFTSSVPY